MKKIYKDKILNIWEPNFDNKFLVPYLTDLKWDDINIIYIEDLLKERKNEKVLEIMGEKYAMYSNVYSPKDEFEIFEKVFSEALEKWQKTHIVWISLREELELVEAYYEKLWFKREDADAFEVDFSKVLVTVSVKIENLIWKGSDYKRMKEKIFFIPPPRESGQNRAMFKGITRWVTSGIYIKNETPEAIEFLNEKLKDENILPLRMWKILCYNLQDFWLKGEEKELIFKY